MKRMSGSEQWDSFVIKSIFCERLKCKFYYDLTCLWRRFNLLVLFSLTSNYNEGLDNKVIDDMNEYCDLLPLLYSL